MKSKYIDMWRDTVIKIFLVWINILTNKWCHSNYLARKRANSLEFIYGFQVLMVLRQFSITITILDFYMVCFYLFNFSKNIVSECNNIYYNLSIFIQNYVGNISHQKFVVRLEDLKMKIIFRDLFKYLNIIYVLTMLIIAVLI